MGYGIDILPNERDALDEVFNLALCDQEDYQQSGNPHSDYGDEWPTVARSKAKTWREAAKLAKRLGWKDTVKRCHTLARNLEASAKEYAEMEASDGPTLTA
jgi:hypothetical protein